jgi:hypothetical protein
MYSTKSLLASAILSLLLLLTLPVEAQTNTQQITGTVTDTTGAVVASATVTATNEGTGVKQTVKTSSDGNYVLPNLDVGIFTVTVEAQGFKESITRGVHLDVGARIAVNANMELGEVSQTVNVEASALQVETESAEVSTLITSTQATNIQLNGRNYVQLIDLAPGTSTIYPSGFALFGPYGVVAAGQSINGLHPDDNTFFIDGINDKDPGGPSSNSFVNVNPDAIAEFNNIEASQSAQYGVDAGGVISMVLKSGTRDFHGTAYEYLRNDAIQAYAYGATVKPPLRYNNFGWNLGGPAFIPNKFNVNRDKLFFFVDQDYKRQSLQTPTFWNVPSAAEHSGNFSALPSSQWPIDPTTGKAFPNGMIPSNRIDANGQAILNLMPKPNSASTSGNFYFLTLAPVNTLQFILRADYHLTPRNQLTFHWAHDTYNYLAGATTAIVFHPTVKGLNSAIQWNAVINSSTVNKVSFSWEGGRIYETQGIGPNPQLGLTSVQRSDYSLTYPAIFGASPDIPQVDFTAGGFNVLTAKPLQFNNNSAEYSLNDDFIKIKGNHTIKAGILAYRNRKNQTGPPQLNGAFVFAGTSGQPTTQGIANALLGTYNTYTEASGIPQAWPRYTDVEPYIGDDWKVSRRLTLNLGFRYAFMGAVNLALNNGANFFSQYFSTASEPVLNQSTGAFVSPIPTVANPYVNGLAIGGTSFPATATPVRVPEVNEISQATLKYLFAHNLPAGMTTFAQGTWSPRLGFAYDLTGKQQTVLRGGFAVSYERMEPTYPDATSSNPPFVQTDVLNNGNVDNPGGGTGTVAPANISAFNGNQLKWPRALNFSLGIQQALGKSTIMDVTYVGTTQADLTYAKNINMVQAGTTIAHPGVALNALRPYLGYGDITWLTNGGNSNYSSLQTELRKEFPQGGIATLSYTWSKALTDDQQENYVPEYAYNLRADYGPAYYNRPQVFVASYVYPLPFWQKGGAWYKQVLGGWQVSGVTNLASGLPINVGNSTDVAGIGSIDNTTNATYNGSALSGKGERPNLVGNPYAGATRYHHLSAAAFANPAPGTFGNLQNFGLRGTLESNWDASVEKHIPFEHLKITFRAEAFDFPNHMSIFAWNSSFGASNLGTPSSAMDPRTFEFALRLEF